MTRDELTKVYGAALRDGQVSREELILIANLNTISRQPRDRYQLLDLRNRIFPQPRRYQVVIRPQSWLRLKVSPAARMPNGWKEGRGGHGRGPIKAFARSRPMKHMRLLEILAAEVSSRLPRGRMTTFGPKRVREGGVQIGNRSLTFIAAHSVAQAKSLYQQLGRQIRSMRSRKYNRRTARAENYIWVFRDRGRGSRFLGQMTRIVHQVSRTNNAMVRELQRLRRSYRASSRNVR